MTDRPRAPWLRWVPVWRRNALFWRKLALPSLIGNFGEPVLYLLALGYGLGRFVGELDGLPYLVFLGSGIICSSAMTSASFEASYSAYTRMTVQDTWDAIITTPLEIGDVVVGEIVWAATKGLLSSVAIVIVCAAIGIFEHWSVILALPVIFLAALCFSAMAMVVTTIARGYEYFLYYTTLFITPMFLLGGVFFPVAQMPDVVARLSTLLPLTHAVALVRPLATGQPVGAVAVHLTMLLGVTAISTAMAIRFARRRLVT